MDQKYYNISYAESPFGTLSQYMTRTYGWMAAGLLVTFATALLTVTTPLFELMFSTGLVFLLSIAELVLVAVLSARVERLQPTTATGLFFAYAVLNGINLSTYFIIYDLSTLILAFLVGTVYFGVMAVYGARTQRDLSGWGINLMGALIAIILTSLVGGLIGMLTGAGFGMMDILLCAVSVLVFMLFTAYDTQKLKYYYAYYGGDASMLHKSSIIGALSLYLDYINIFLYIVLFAVRPGLTKKAKRPIMLYVKRIDGESMPANLAQRGRPSAVSRPESLLAEVRS